MAKLKYQGIESNVDSENEKRAILSFLDRYWDVKIEGDWQLPKVVDYIFDKGIKYGIALRESVVEPEIERHNTLASYRNNHGRKIEFTGISRKRNFRFEREMGALEKRLGKHVQITAKPKGYEEFCAAHPEEFPDDENDEKLEFNGTKLHSSIGAGCFNFEESLSRAHVKYDDKSQGRSPSTTMISTIFRQGINIGVLVVEQNLEKVFKDFY